VASGHVAAFAELMAGRHGDRLDGGITAVEGNVNRIEMVKRQS
jgi:hypothetical protein